MTDREKLEAAFIAFDIPIKDGEHSFIAAGRRYYFDSDGVLERIKEEKA